MSAVLSSLTRLCPSDSAWTVIPSGSDERTTLLVTAMSREKSGAYACEAENGIGSPLSAEFRISVQGIVSFPSPQSSAQFARHSHVSSQQPAAILSVRDPSAQPPFRF